MKAIRGFHDDPEVNPEPLPRPQEATSVEG